MRQSVARSGGSSVTASDPRATGGRTVTSTIGRVPSSPTVIDPATITAALARVLDPEIGKPITELDMVRSVRVDDDGAVAVEVLLTVSGCPLRDEITNRLAVLESK